MEDRAFAAVISFVMCVTAWFFLPVFAGLFCSASESEWISFIGMIRDCRLGLEKVA